ncbi:MAG TPA: hypothetical protein IGS52_03255 [Oscillatoriaceae cyanobacterium M33_DOE_052]|nr:hypothetical protein [Oscillatoriaceae cyanobacterium M33_DOE_052]
MVRCCLASPPHARKLSQTFCRSGGGYGGMPPAAIPLPLASIAAEYPFKHL